jgi:hypothetical protein
VRWGRFARGSTVNGVKVRADFVTKDANGNMHVFEAKNANSHLTKNQAATGVYDMNRTSNQAGGGVNVANGTQGQFTVATSNPKHAGGIGTKGSMHNATFHVLHY